MNIYRAMLKALHSKTRGNSWPNRVYFSSQLLLCISQNSFYRDLVHSHLQAIVSVINNIVEELKFLVAIALGSYMDILGNRFPVLKRFTWIPLDYSINSVLTEFLNNHPHLESIQILFPVLHRPGNLGTADPIVLDLPSIREFEAPFPYLAGLGVAVQQLTKLRVHIQSEWTPEVEQLIRSAQNLEKLDLVLDDDNLGAFRVLAAVSSFSLPLVSLRISQRLRHRRSTVSLIILCLLIWFFIRQFSV